MSSNTTVNKERRWIRPLPERLINKIAAGEVIERPASVLKELAENSLDAESTQVDIVIEQSGLSRIEVHDNGIGIPANQVEIAFSRHATSKIADFDDLESVLTHGFRGEALPSIASVSRLQMITKSAEDDHATEITVRGGVIEDVRPAHRAQGTSVIVEDLFFNTPARKKFLKSESTEARHLSRAATALALGSLGRGLSVKLNGRRLFTFAVEDSLALRAARTLGVASDALIAIDAEQDGFSLIGALGRPELARQMRGGLYLYVNGRALRTSPLLSAFNLGYGELLPRGLFPVGVAQLSVDGRTIDVNVHPAKSEVRLSHEREAHTFIRHAVADALRQVGVTPSLSFGGPKQPEETPGPKILTDFSSRSVSYNRSPEDASPPTTDPTAALFGSQLQEIPHTENNSAEAEGIFSRNQSELLPEGVRYLGQFANLYLIAQRAEELFLLDQHAAHERILYEETMQKLERDAIVSQRLLLPINVELNAEQFMVWEERQNELDRVGFEMSHMGGNTVMLSATPAILTRRSSSKIFTQALEDIQKLSAAGYTPLKAVAQSIACRSAVMDGDPLGSEQASAIIAGVFACKAGYSCPHGRPTLIRISKAELDRRFGRE